MKKLNKKGFTLVELLAVIVILALLMVVSLSVMGNVQNNAKKTALIIQDNTENHRRERLNGYSRRFLYIVFY